NVSATRLLQFPESAVRVWPGIWGARGRIGLHVRPIELRRRRRGERERRRERTGRTVGLGLGLGRGWFDLQRAHRDVGSGRWWGGLHHGRVRPDFGDLVGR